MAVRKKKATPVAQAVVSARVEKPAREVPEIPNTVHFYSHDQNLIRMESLDKKIKIDAPLIKSILDEIKERLLYGTNLFVVVYNEDGESFIDEIVDLNAEDLDEDLLKVVLKISPHLGEKTDEVEE